MPSFHNQATKYQACTLCHTQIHGSNFDPGVLPLSGRCQWTVHGDSAASWLGLTLLAVCVCLASHAFAQSFGPSPTATPTTVSTDADPAPPGKEIGDFQVMQSIELGGRISDVTGSQAMYDTLENYQTGARILEQSLTMQSLTHPDIFDTLTLNSFGWGGDPEQAARLRIAKYRWYTFSGSLPAHAELLRLRPICQPAESADRHRRPFRS